MSKKAFVTGCSGFIGSHLSEALVNLGWEVIGVDCFNDNYSRKIKEANMKFLLSQPRFIFLQDDLMDIQLDSYLKDIDYVFHQAGQPGVRGSWGSQFDNYVSNNILVTQRLLESAKKYNIKKFVYASSSSVYGNTKRFPTSELVLPKPFSPYGLTKLAAENLCGLYYENYGVPVVSLRYFTVFGPRQRPDMAISRFINLINEGRSLDIFGDGKQKRDFTYVEDIVRANIFAANSKVEGEVFNVGSGNPVELIEVINSLEKKIGKKAKLNYISNQRGDVRDTSADSSKIEEMLGFKPSVDLEVGLAKQVEYALGRG